MTNEKIKKIEEEYARDLLKRMQEWERGRLEKILRILNQYEIALTLENIPEIIRSTSFQIISNPKNSNYCRLFTEGKSCHPELDNLNCFLCACPNYDSGFMQISNDPDYKILIGKCKREDNKGKYHFSKEFPRIGVWDCDLCPINHDPKELEKFLIQNLERLKQEFS